jgi:hypothetical protein
MPTRWYLGSFAQTRAAHPCRGRYRPSSSQPGSTEFHGLPTTPAQRPGARAPAGRRAYEGFCQRANSNSPGHDQRGHEPQGDARNRETDEHTMRSAVGHTTVPESMKPRDSARSTQRGADLVDSVKDVGKAVQGNVGRLLPQRRPLGWHDAPMRSRGFLCRQADKLVCLRHLASRIRIDLPQGS